MDTEIKSNMSENEEAEILSDVESDTSEASGRSSDDEYIMEDFDKIAEALEELVNRPFDKTRPMQRIIKIKTMKGKEYQNLSYYIVDDEIKIAGGTHKLFVIKIKFRDGLQTKLLKLARDEEEDTEEHFEKERTDTAYLTELSKKMNSTYTNVNKSLFVWPVDSVLLEIDGEEKWGLLQAPFIPPDDNNKYCFTKVDPNVGEPLEFDPMVQRYQHCMSALSKGMTLVRDWQGFRVDLRTFRNVLRTNNMLDNQFTKMDNVYVLIDFVLVTAYSHFNTRNMLDYGMEAMQEWREYHICSDCNCKAFGLKKEMVFGIDEEGIEFFERSKQKSENNQQSKTSKKPQHNHQQPKKNKSNKHHQKKRHH